MFYFDLAGCDGVCNYVWPEYVSTQQVWTQRVDLNLFKSRDV